MAVEMRASAKLQSLSEQGRRAFHIERLVQRERLLVQLDDLVQRSIVLLGGARGAGQCEHEAREGCAMPGAKKFGGHGRVRDADKAG